MSLGGGDLITSAAPTGHGARGGERVAKPPAGAAPALDVERGRGRGADRLAPGRGLRQRPRDAAHRRGAAGRQRDRAHCGPSADAGAVSPATEHFRAERVGVCCARARLVGLRLGGHDRARVPGGCGGPPGHRRPGGGVHVPGAEGGVPVCGAGPRREGPLRNGERRPGVGCGGHHPEGCVVCLVPCLDLVVRCLDFVVRCVGFVVRCLCFVVCCVGFVVCCVGFVVRCVGFVVRSLDFAVRCLDFVVRCVCFVVCCVDFVMRCVCFVVCCVGFVVCCVGFVLCCVCFAVCCLDFVVPCSGFVVRCVVFVVRSLDFVVRCVSFVVRCAGFVVRCAGFVVCCVGFVVRCVVFVVRCVDSVVRCVDFVVCCLDFVVPSRTGRRRPPLRTGCRRTCSGPVDGATSPASLR